MINLHPDVIEAAYVEADWQEMSNENRARRVINALAEHPPEEAIEEARKAFNAEDYVPLKLRAAIAAFLKSAGEME